MARQFGVPAGWQSRGSAQNGRSFYRSCVLSLRKRTRCSCPLGRNTEWMLFAFCEPVSDRFAILLIAYQYLSDHSIHQQEQDTHLPIGYTNNTWAQLYPSWQLFGHYIIITCCLQRLALFLLCSFARPNLSELFSSISNDHSLLHYIDIGHQCPHANYTQLYAKAFPSLWAIQVGKTVNVRFAVKIIFQKIQKICSVSWHDETLFYLYLLDWFILYF